MIAEYDKERLSNRIRGEVHISADIRVSDFITEGAVYVTVTESSLYERICQYAFQYGEDLQGMFRNENMNICPALYGMWQHSELNLKRRNTKPLLVMIKVKPLRLLSVFPRCITIMKSLSEMNL